MTIAQLMRQISDDLKEIVQSNRDFCRRIEEAMNPNKTMGADAENKEKPPAAVMESARVVVHSDPLHVVMSLTQTGLKSVQKADTGMESHTDGRNDPLSLPDEVPTKKDSIGAKFYTPVALKIGNPVLYQTNGSAQQAIPSHIQYTSVPKFEGDPSLVLDPPSIGRRGHMVGDHGQPRLQSIRTDWPPQHQQSIKPAFVYQSNLSQPVTQEGVAEMIRAAIQNREMPMIPSWQRPYPEWVDQEYKLPHGFKIPEFTKFTGDDYQRPADHLHRFELQCGDTGQNEYLKLRLFSHSLADSALEWYYALQPNTIHSWAQMQRVFYENFYKIGPVVTIVDLFQTVQQPEERVGQYLKRFKAIIAKCQSSVSETDVIRIAVAGIRDYEIRKRLSGKRIKDFHILFFKASEFEKVQKEEKEEVCVFPQGQSVNMVDVRPIVKHLGGSKQCNYGHWSSPNDDEVAD